MKRNVLYFVFICWRFCFNGAKSSVCFRLVVNVWHFQMMKENSLLLSDLSRSSSLSHSYSFVPYLLYQRSELLKRKFKRSQISCVPTLFESEIELNPQLYSEKLTAVSSRVYMKRNAFEWTRDEAANCEIKRLFTTKLKQFHYEFATLCTAYV